MAPPRGAILSLRALLGAPGGPYKSLKWPEYLIFFPVHSDGLIAGIWSFQGLPGPLQHSWSPQNGPFWPQRTLFGPRGPSRTKFGPKCQRLVHLGGPQKISSTLAPSETYTALLEPLKGPVSSIVPPWAEPSWIL